MQEDQPPRRITEPLPPIVPAPTKEEQELKIAQRDLQYAQAHLDRLALLTAQVRLIQRKGPRRYDRYPV